MNKKCSRCLETKDLEEFSIDRRNKKDGRQSRCKECGLAYRIKNRERERQRASKYYYNDHEGVLERRAELRKRPEAKTKKAEQDKRYRQLNKEKLNQKSYKWVKENRDKVRIIQKKWYDANYQEKKARFLAKNHRRRVRLLENNNTLSKEEIALLFSKMDSCFYCQKKDIKLTLDHVVPLSRGGANSIENIVLACGPCNSSKGAKTLDEWLKRLSP